jgi:hypothetical protein
MLSLLPSRHLLYTALLKFIMWKALLSTVFWPSFPSPNNGSGCTPQFTHNSNCEGGQWFAGNAAFYIQGDLHATQENTWPSVAPFEQSRTGQNRTELIILVIRFSLNWVDHHEHLVGGADIQTPKCA